ncbi:MAG: DUF4212 domain-containing protein [Planctomycetota bacterium]
MAQSESALRERHWHKTRTLTIWILAIWFVFAFLFPWFAKELDNFTFLGFKLGYYMIVQGSLIAFVVMIWVQNWIQDRIDDEYDAAEEQKGS